MQRNSCSDGERASCAEHYSIIFRNSMFEYLCIVYGNSAGFFIFMVGYSGCNRAVMRGMCGSLDQCGGQGGGGDRPHVGRPHRLRR